MKAGRVIVFTVLAWPLVDACGTSPPAKLQGAASVSFANLYAAVVKQPPNERSAAVAALSGLHFATLLQRLLPLVGNQTVSVGDISFTKLHDRLLQRAGSLASLDQSYADVGTYWRSQGYELGALSVESGVLSLASDLRNASQSLPADEKPELALDIKQRLLAIGCDVLWDGYDMYHTYSPSVRTPAVPRDGSIMVAYDRPAPPAKTPCVKVPSLQPFAPGESRLLATFPDTNSALLPPGVGPVVQSAVLLATDPEPESD